MAINVIYYSRKGNTKKAAEAIAEACGVTAIDISVPHVLGETSLLFVGMGIYNGKPDQALLNYLDNLPNNKIKEAAVFSTSRSGKYRMELAVQHLNHKGIHVYPKHLALKGQYFLFNRHRPHEGDLKKAKKFAYAVMNACNE